jgi:hypothetical protein
MTLRIPLIAIFTFTILGVVHPNAYGKKSASVKPSYVRVDFGLRVPEGVVLGTDLRNGRPVYFISRFLGEELLDIRPLPRGIQLKLSSDLSNLLTGQPERGAPATPASCGRLVRIGSWERGNKSETLASYCMDSWPPAQASALSRWYHEARTLAHSSD